MFIIENEMKKKKEGQEVVYKIKSIELYTIP